MHNASDVLFGGLFFVPLALVLTMPLLVMAIVAGVIFRTQIAKRTLLWTIGASLATWITAISVMVFDGSKNEWWMSHTNVERLTHVLASSDNMLILAGAAGAGATFYLLGLVRLGRKRAA